MTSHSASADQATHAARNESVLILDGDMTPALAIARSLGRRGLRVVVASHEQKPIAGFSRFSSETLVYPNPLERQEDFLNWCRRILDQRTFRLIIPVTERTVVPALSLLEHANARTIAVAPPAAIKVALDKNETTLLAGELGIPTPQSQKIDNIDELETCRTRLHMPVVIKPIRSIGANSRERKHLSVEYAFNERELEVKTRDFLHFGPVLLQDYVQGQGVGIELIAEHGEIRYAFQHLRLHEVPLTGGGSSFRTSVPIEPELLDASQKLMKALEWHGVAMVEFKWQADTRKFALMEINGRFWGSLPLAVAAGADFPAMLYELITDGSIVTRPAARESVYCRKLSSDIAWTEMVIRREAPAQLVRFPTASGVLRDWARVFHPRHHFDVQQWRDPLPGTVDVLRIVQSLGIRGGGLAKDWVLRKRHRRAWKRGEVQRLMGKASQVLFICYGNINRSALAEKCFQQQHPSHRVRALSAGFHDEPNRPADPVMTEVASHMGIDLSNWSSRTLDSKMLSSSDIVFVMELSHYEQICERFPEACRKTYLLGAGDDRNQGSDEIADPYGKARQYYENCARQVQSAVSTLTGYL